MCRTQYGLPHNSFSPVTLSWPEAAVQTFGFGSRDVRGVGCGRQLAWEGRERAAASGSGRRMDREIINYHLPSQNARSAIITTRPPCERSVWLSSTVRPPLPHHLLVSRRRPPPPRRPDVVDDPGHPSLCPQHLALSRPCREQHTRNYYVQCPPTPGHYPPSIVVRFFRHSPKVCFKFIHWSRACPIEGVLWNSRQALLEASPTHTSRPGLRLGAPLLTPRLYHPRVHRRPHITKALLSPLFLSLQVLPLGHPTHPSRRPPSLNPTPSCCNTRSRPCPIMVTRSGPPR